MTTTTRAPAIRVQGIEKSFKDLHVLRGVDFDVQAGSIFALLGSNGAGKTTLVRILSTLLKADAGTATVHGFDVADEARRRARVDQPDRPVRRGRRGAHRPGEPRAGRQAASPEEPGRDRRRPARPLLAHRRRATARRRPTRAACAAGSTSR